jgi:hypothetical protein
MDGKYKIFLIFLLGCIGLQAQTFTYNYTDPCTGILQSVTLSQTSGTVVMFYAGQYQTFTAAQLQSGAYENWIAQINTQFPPGSNPCAGNGSSNANNSNANIGTNTANNVSGIVSISTSIAGSLGGGSVSGGSISTGGSGGTGDNNSGGDAGENGAGNGGSNSGSSGGSGTKPPTGGSSGSSGSGGSGSGGSSSGGSSGGGQGSGGSGGGGQPEGGVGGSEGGGTSGGTTEGSGTSESGAVGGQENTTTASGGESESSSGESGGGGGGNKPKQKQEKIGRGSLIGSGDFVVIRNGNDITKNGGDNFRFNTSVTHVNTKQNFIKGVNLNYTTGENVANLTLYGSYKSKGFMGVGSNSMMTNFKSDWFNTTTLLSAQKLGRFTGMAGTNFTLGQIGDSWFQNWSLVGGGFTNFKGGKVVSANIMALGVYSPFIFYYEGQWYKSGVLIVPLANVDFKLTEKFKWSISFSGAYQWNADILNFQLSTGTKMLL